MANIPGLRRALLALTLIVLALMQPVPAGDTVTVTGVIESSPALAADFSGSPVTGYAPLAVAFTDRSTGTVAGYAWDFTNDGTTDSTKKNPAHTYFRAGTYTVKLTVTGPGGITDEEVKTGYITVLAPARPPAARFVQDAYIGRAPLTVRFTDISRNNPESWSWQFGDGSTASVKDPVHTFSIPGFYVIRERVSNAAGSDTALSWVFVLNNRWW